MNVDLTAVKPYGDSINDGQIQISFSLPMTASEQAGEAAKLIARKMGLEEVNAVYMKDLGEGFSYHILYGKLKDSIDATKIKVAELGTDTLDFYQTNEFIKIHIGRKIVVVGACTGTDAHTVGLDAIMNMKGYAGEYGLERYPEIETYNLGSQVKNEDLIQTAIEVKADAILVSQIVSQKNVHVKNMTHLVELMEAENIRDDFIVIAGGPRINHEFAIEMGMDAGFGPGTLPPMVASYIAGALAEKIRLQQKDE